MRKLSKTDAAFIELQSSIALAEWAKKFRGCTWRDAIEKFLEYYKDLNSVLLYDGCYEFWSERLKDEKEKLPFTTPTEDLLSYWKKRSLFKDGDTEYIKRKSREIYSMGLFLNMTRL